MTTTPRSRLRTPAVVAIIVVLGAALTGWLAIGSPLFQVDRVVVRGTRHLDPAAVRALAAVPERANLWRLGLDEIADRVRRDPWVASASVRRDLPSTLVVEIRERRPGGWVGDRDGVVVLAGDGTLLERRSRPPGALPELAGVGALVPAGDVPVTLRVAGSMPLDLLRRVERVAEDPEGVLAILRDGGEVRYGPPTLLDEKHAAARSVLRWAEQRGMTVGVVDVGVPSAPTLRPPGKGTAVPAPAPSPTTV